MQRRHQAIGWATAFFAFLTLTTALQSRLGIRIAAGLIGEARADNIAYAFDASGRLIQATDTTTQQAIFYTYDSVGNITSQQAVSLTILAVSGLSADQGAPGSQFTIDGTGFSSTPSANTVMINNAAATVVSATPTQLVVSIPSGATSGLISVTTSSTTVNSSSAFTIAAGGAPPTITSFSPTIGAPGTIVSVAGTGFQPTPANDEVELNETWAQVSSGSTTSLTFSVPAQATSGPVTVATPYGQVVSTTDFIVPPTGYSASHIGSTGMITVGAPATVTVSSASMAALRLFNGTKGQLLAIGVSADTIASSTIKVFDPAGNLLVTAAAITASGQGLQIPALPRDGTYTIVVDPGGNTGALTLEVYGPVQGTLSQGGAALPITLAVPGQAAQLTFGATQGAYVTLTLSSAMLSAGMVNILDPSGSVLMSGSVGPAGLSLQPQLPVSGTYTVQIIPIGSISGSMSVALSSTAAPAITANATPINLSTFPGSLTFRGGAGQYLGLNVSEGGPGNSLSGALISVLKPDGTQLAQATFTASSCTGGCGGSVDLYLGPLPSSGTYIVLVQETAGGSATLSVTLTGPTGGALTFGTAQNVSITSGQPVQDTFSGTAGQYVGLNVSEGGGNGNNLSGALVTVLKPDGTQLVQDTLMATCVANAGCSGMVDVALGPLPQVGTYTVLVQETSGFGSALSITVTNPVGGALTIGTTQSEIINAGQPVQDTFSGTAGQYVGLNVSEGGGNGNNLTGALVTVLKPDGTQLAQDTLTATCVANAGCSGMVDVALGPLPQVGTYTVLVQETSGFGSALSITVTNPVGGALTIGTTQSEIINAGQPVQDTFSGTAGQYVGLNVSEGGGNGNNLSGALVTVLKPDGTQLAQDTLTATCVANAGCSGMVDVALGPLPQAGTYTVLVQETSGFGSALSITVTNPVGGALTIGTTQSEIINAGQPVQDTFSGTAGQYVGLNVSEGGGNGNNLTGALVTVLKPDGTQLAQDTLTATCVANAGCSGTVNMALGLLPQAGTYTVLVQETVGGGTALNITLSRQATTTTLASSQSPSPTGQAVTFTATVTGSSPSGTVSFSDGGTALGTVSLSNGSASLTTSSLAQGSHPITVAYSGDISNLPSTSPVMFQTVVTLTTTTITWISGFAPPASVTHGHSFNVQACLKGSTQSPPSGTVTFLDGSTVLTTYTLFFNQFNGCSVAGPAITMPTAGSRTLVVQYPGDTVNTAASLSTPITVN